MNLYSQLRRYTFFAPDYSPCWAPLLVRGGALMLRHRFRVQRLQVTGLERVRELKAKGHPILLSPNHADHADPSALLVAGRQHGLAFQFMAARECFEQGRMSAFVMQRLGCFSVDREGADVAAIKTALKILDEARHPLVVFPEGEIWHHHETLDELNEGVSAIALRASSGKGLACHVVPVGLRFCHDPAIAETFSERLARLERTIWWKPRPAMPVVDRIYRLGRGLLAIKEEEYLGHAQSGDLASRIVSFQRELVETVEDTLQQKASSDRVPDRVKALRRVVRRELTESMAPLPPERRTLLLDQLDTLFLVVQLYSYPGNYLRESPSVDRIAETVFKLEEDVLGRGTYPLPRSAFIRCGEPIDVRAFAAARGLTAKTGVGPLTRHLAEAIQREVAQAAPAR